MEQLKKAFDASRSFQKQSMSEAAEELGVSRTMLNSFFKGAATSAPLEKRIREYINDAGVVESIQRLDLDINIQLRHGNKEVDQ